MQKAISPHTTARKHLSPKLSGKCSATICQLENKLLFICSRAHLFSWQAGMQQRQLTGTLVPVISAGDMKETQKLCSMHHGCVAVAVTCFRDLSPWLSRRSFPRKSKSLALVRSRGGRLPPRTGATGSAWCLPLGLELLVASTVGAVLWLMH